jgi:hypothetical protein
MEKEFIPYEQALALKVLGFDEPCVAFYYGQLNRLEIGFNWTNEGCKNSLLEEIVSAPLYQQAFRWFRKKHNLFHSINSLGYNMCLGLVGQLGKLKPCNVPNYGTYEEAELECLKKLIEIVKTKQNG